MWRFFFGRKTVSSSRKSQSSTSFRSDDKLKESVPEVIEEPLDKPVQLPKYTAEEIDLSAPAKREPINDPKVGFYEVDEQPTGNPKDSKVGFYSVEESPAQNIPDEKLGFYSVEEAPSRATFSKQQHNMKVGSYGNYLADDYVDKTKQDFLNLYTANDSTHIETYSQQDDTTSQPISYFSAESVEDEVAQEKQAAKELWAKKLNGLSYFDQYVTDKNGVRDWNEEINRFFESRTENSCSTTNSGMWMRFSATTRQFSDTAVLYAKIIISELGVPFESKTIKPIDVGGVAGGQKYIYNNILFKFALDTKIFDDPDPVYMYGGKLGPSDSYAMKASKNELKGLGMYATSRVAGLYYPLITVIDYKGYRIIAMNVLPIGKSTLKYGSNDSGRTVKMDNPKLNNLMQAAANSLNLKGHVTGQAGQKKTIYGPGDIEAHEGLDGRFYVLDFGRVLPPEDPRIRNEATKRGVFYNLLRPELVRPHKTPLCSDAFTAWNSDDDPEARQKNNEEVAELSHHLYETIIPNFAKELDENASNIDWDHLWSTRSPQEIRNTINKYLGNAFIHSKGINLRHLGAVRFNVKNPHMRLLLLCICVSRVIKDDIYERMRDIMKDVRVPSDEPFKETISNLLNIVSGTSKQSVVFWQDEVKCALQKKYVACLSEDEKEDAFDLKSIVNFRVLFTYLLRLTAIKLKSTAISHLMNNPSTFRCVPSDIKSLDEKVQSIFLVDFAEAMHLYYRSNSDFTGEEEKYNEEERLRLVEEAIEHIKRAHNAAPTCALLYHRWASLQTLMATLSPVDKTGHFERAVELFDKMNQFWSGYGAGLEDFVACLRQYAGILADNEEKRNFFLAKASEIEVKVKTLPPEAFFRLK